MLVIENGKIAAVGAESSVHVPKDAQVIDASGMTVYPGLIDSETELGLTEISAEDMTNDLVETSDEIMPHMHVYDAFHAGVGADSGHTLERDYQRDRGSGESGYASGAGFVCATRGQDPRRMRCWCATLRCR